MKENLEQYKKISNEKFSNISFNNDIELEHNNINYKKNQTPIKKIKISNKYCNLKDFLKNENKKYNVKKIMMIFKFVISIQKIKVFQI